MAYSALFKLDSHDLHSEAEVETRLLAPLFENLGYPIKSVIPKKSVPPLIVQSGVKKSSVQVDFILKAATGAPRIVVEAKKPKELLADAWGQAAGYALSFNRDKEEADRIKWLLISNGHLTSLYRHDSGIATLTLRLTDFVSGSPPWAALRSYIKFQNADTAPSTALAFDVVTPDELNKLFSQAHQLIWKKQKLAPQDAFFEFCKFVFLKITEDKKREASSNKAKKLFPLTTPWLMGLAAHPHPVRDLLFVALRDDLDAQIAHGKKRIYDQNEPFRLTADTCRELIKRFEPIDLSSIDEDLNGRMFEVFLNEAVRGKDLGQYFTPRPLVEFMTRVGLLDFGDAQTRPKIIDPCCGTAGFLIEAMAFEVSDARNARHLTPIQRSKLVEHIKNETLFGAEANERVSRVARINMYLHGDGGSHIFNGDGLDNDPQIADDMTAEQKDEVSDYIASVKDGNFDLVLTNPPFSMAYSVTEPDEERILRQLATEDVAPEAEAAESEDVSPLESNKTKSNILFLFRNHQLLKPGGQILVVVDDTILNGETCQTVRNWLLKHFVVLGIHSLPFNAFFKAKANIKTSAIHLKKKEAAGDVQGHVFMSVSNNIGHDSALNDTPHRNNLNDIFNVYSEWKRTGKFAVVCNRNQDGNENLECPEQIFLVAPNELSPKRLDAFYYAPELIETRGEIRRLAEEEIVTIKTGREIARAPRITKAERATLAASNERLRYIEIGDVTDYGLIVTHRVGTIGELPSRGQYQIQKGDVLVAINNSSRGTVVLVPEQFAGTICTSGFLVLRPRNENEGLLLWFALRSELCRRQIYYLAQTASQPELKLGAWESEFLIPVPKGKERAAALAKARKFQSHIAELLSAASIRLMPKTT